ncbi:class I SAM-dependent methyltransferase [Streptomyces sp. NPDC006617]|uniref:class I SAM-dependent methyltransferase n=1 Tax=Streptomyces sp. NPDC006617 TaxID=3155354 RepID=UPI0033AAD811
MAHDHHHDDEHHHDPHGSADAQGHAQGHGPGHTHTHDHADIDWSEMAPHLEAQAELYTPLYRQALSWLAGEVTEPGLIVDVGSGPGVVASLFADTFPGARVVAADGAGPLLDRARARAERLGFGDRFGALAGDLPGALAELDYPADLMWASQSLHHLPDQRAALAALGGHLAPGGTLAILEGGLPARFLPRDIGTGRPGLQARIRAVEEDAFAEMRADLPDAVAEAEDWPAMLTAAGLKHTGTRSFLLDLPAPLSDAARDYVTTSLSRLRDRIGERLDAEDRATLDRLLDPADEAGVHRRQDLFVLVAHTVYTAVRPV